MPRNYLLYSALTLCAALPVAGQTNQTNASAGRGELYHVHFVKAAPGKAVQLATQLAAPMPDQGAIAGHRVVLRHQSGDDWDYVTIEHLGPKFTLEGSRQAPPAANIAMRDWHEDTYAVGPAWAEFARVLGIGGDATAKTGESIYIVAVFRAAPGHRDQLEKLIQQSDPGDKAAGDVLLEHLEGSRWQYLTITRYNSWQDYATSEAESRAQMKKNEGGWFRVRDHTAFHTDTLADRIVP